MDLRPSDQDGIGRVTIQFDTNGDGNYDLFPFPNDNLFVTYLHMKDISVNVGAIVTISDTVGLVSNVGASAVHLHWEINTITGTSNCTSNFRAPGCTAVRTSLYYIGLSGTQWNGGRDLDFISDIAWVNGRRAEGYVYTMDNGVKRRVDQGDVILFHRAVGGTWQNSVMNRAGDLFLLDLSAFYPSGTELELYGRARRSDIPRPAGNCGTSPYNYSFMKPRKYRPDPCIIEPLEIFHVLLVY